MIKQELSEMYWKYVLSYYLLFYSVWLQRWFEAIWMDQIIRKNGEKENSEQKQTSRSELQPELHSLSLLLKHVQCLDLRQITYTWK